MLIASKTILQVDPRTDHHTVLCFLEFQASFCYHFGSVYITSFSHYLRGSLLATHSMSFPSSENGYFPFISEGYFHHMQNSRLTVLFLKNLKMCCFLLAPMDSDEKLTIIRTAVSQRQSIISLQYLSRSFIFSFQMFMMCLGVDFFGFILFWIY